MHAAPYTQCLHRDSHVVVSRLIGLLLVLLLLCCLLLQHPQVRQPSPAAAADAAGLDDLSGMQLQQGVPFRLPAPPSPYKSQLPEAQ
jgi:hypothetical protein